MRAYLAMFVLAAGCLGDGDKGDEDDLGILDDKADSFRKPTYHGVIPFDVPMASAITDTEQFHAWTFTLTGDARVELVTSYAVRGQRRTDTVLYLYKHDGTSWGPYIARNDDYGNTTYSKIVKNLGAGEYRALVKGYKSMTRGKFTLTARCEGEGCAPPVDPDACLFGETYWELRDQEHLQLSTTLKITPANLATLSPENQQRLVRAVQESSHTDVTTPAEALSRVDQQELDLTRIWDVDGRRVYLAFEYGVGDNSYGAIFDEVSDARAASIHDGDLLNCEPRREVCLLPEDWRALRQSTAFTVTASRTVTSASQLAGVSAEQVLRTVRRVYGDPALALEGGIAQADGGSINLHTYRHLASNRVVDVVEFGAGDTSVGALYHGGTTELAGVIDDLFIEGCSLFE